MRRGFTLVELLIVMTILAVLMVMAIGILNPIALVNKGHDATRKKDLARIKVAFEEYYNDKGCYPSGAKLGDLNNSENCGSSTVFSPWLSNWPCDPIAKKPYDIFVENPDCPHWFKIYSNLQNRLDKDIPPNYYSGTVHYILPDDLYPDRANYGVSSSNVLWYSVVE